MYHLHVAWFILVTGFISILIEFFRINGTNCEDIDECSVDSLEDVKCTQNCLNTNGSYSCTCSAGYALEPDGYHCKAEGIHVYHET